MSNCYSKKLGVDHTVQTGAYTAITSEYEKKGWPQPIGITRYFLPNTQNGSANLPGVVLERFTSLELRGAWTKVKIKISLDILSEQTRNLVRHPYCFKLFAELYKLNPDTSSLLSTSTFWELSRLYYERRLPPNRGRHRNPARTLLNEIIAKLLERRFIWLSVLELADDTDFGRYFIDYEANKPYAELLNYGILWELAIPDQSDVRVTVSNNQFFPYALYEYLQGRDNLTAEDLADAVIYLLPQLAIRLGSDDLDKQMASIEYFQTLRNFWHLPMVEALPHLLINRWNAGEKRFVMEFLGRCYWSGAASWVAEQISIKLIEIAARESPKELGQLIPSVISCSPLPLNAADMIFLPKLFDDLAENALAQEATSIVDALLVGRSNNPDEIVELYLLLARVHSAVGNNQQRIENLLEANRHATTSGNTTKMGRVANALGVFYNETGGDPATAIHWLEQGLEYAANAGQSQESIAASHFNLGVAHAKQGSFRTALWHLEQSLSLIDKDKEPSRAAQICARIGSLYHNQKNLDQAANAYERAASFYENANRIDQVIHLTLRMGQILMMQGQFQIAAARFQRTLDLANKSDVDMPLDQRFALMANLALSLARDDYNAKEAIDWFEQASKFHSNFGLTLNPDYFANQCNFARFLTHLGRYSEATTIYTATLSKIDGLPIGDKNSEVIAHTLKAELGALYIQTGSYDSGVEYIIEALPFIQEMNVLGDLYITLGTGYRGQGLTAKAVEYYKKGVSLVKRLGVSPDLASIEAYITDHDNS